MLIGYVSDEQFLALPDVAVELINPAGQRWATHSTASGAIEVAVPPGDYEVILNKPGYGAKRVPVTLGNGQPHHFRLLRDELLGYVWPKWSRAGELAEFRVHAPQAYKLGL